MSRVRLLSLAGAGILLAGLPAGAATAPVPGGASSALAEATALRLLERAADAARRLAYTGTQYVATWNGGAASSVLAEVRSAPATGLIVTPAEAAAPQPEQITATSELDPRLLPLLAERYQLSVGAPETCTGRAAAVVEARRGTGSLAGRFWVDQDSGLLLRREMYDETARRVRSSAYVSLTVHREVPPTTLVQSAVAFAPESTSVAPDELTAIRADGWQVPEALPQGLTLFDARVRDHSGVPVLHLAYSDGLSMLSVFAQRGALSTSRLRGFRREQVGPSTVWVGGTQPERVVWSGAGHVWTLVADAPTSTVHAAVAALPQDEPVDDGMLARLGRGLSRVGSWLNPFS